MKQSPIKTPSTPSGTAAQAVVDRLNAKEKIVREVFTKKGRKNSRFKSPVQAKSLNV